MWFGNELGGSVLARGDARLKPWPTRFLPAPRQVLSLATAADGAIWASLYDHRILRYDPVTGVTTLEADLPRFIKVNHFDRQGRLWIGAMDGIYRIDHAAAGVQHMSAAPTTNAQCSDIAEDGQGALWFACNAGVLRFTDNQWTAMSVAKLSTVSGFSAIAVGTDNSLWLGGNHG